MKLTDLRGRFTRQPGPAVPADVGADPAPDPALAPVVRNLATSLPLPATLMSGDGQVSAPVKLVPYGWQERAGPDCTSVYAIHYPDSHPTWVTLWNRNYGKLGWVPRALAHRFDFLAAEARGDDWEDYTAPDGRKGLMVWYAGER